MTAEDEQTLDYLRRLFRPNADEESALNDHFDRRPTDPNLTNTKEN